MITVSSVQEKVQEQLCLIKIPSSVEETHTHTDVRCITTSERSS